LEEGRTVQPTQGLKNGRKADNDGDDYDDESDFSCSKIVILFIGHEA